MSVPQFTPGLRRLGTSAVVALTASAAVAVSSAAAAEPSPFTVLPTVTATIPLSQPQNAYQTAYDPGTGLLYVANPAAERIDVVYTAQATPESTGGVYATTQAANTVVERISLAGAAPYGLTVDRETHRVYATATPSDKLVVIQGNTGEAASAAVPAAKATIVATRTIEGHIREARAFTGVPDDPSDNRVYVSVVDEDEVVEVDRDGRTKRVFDDLADPAAHPNAHWAAGLALNDGGSPADPADDVLYVTSMNQDAEADGDRNGLVNVIRRKTGERLQTIDAESHETTSLAYSATQHRLYAVGQSTEARGDEGTVATFEVAPDGKLTLLHTQKVGKGALGVDVDEHNGLVYVTNLGGGNTVSVLDADTGEAKDAPLTVGTRPLGVAVDPVSHAAFVTNQQDATVSVLNGPVPKPESRNEASVKNETHGAVAAGDALTLSGEGFSPGQAVSVKLDDAGDPIATFTAGGDGTFSGPVAVPTGAQPGVRHTVRVLGAAGDGVPARSLVAFIDVSGTTDEAKVGGTVDVKTATRAYQSAYDPGTGLLYVADPGNLRVQVIYTAQATRNSTGGRYVAGNGDDPEPNTVVARIDVSAAPVYGLGINSRTGTLYGTATTTGDGELVEIDLQHDRIRSVVDAPGHIRDVRVDEQHGKAYVVAYSTDDVIEYDEKTNEITRRLPVAFGGSAADDRIDQGPGGIAIDAEHGRLYVANIGDAGEGHGSVSVIDIASGAVLQAIDTGIAGTTTVAYDAATQRVVATSQGAAVPPPYPSGGVTTFAVSATDGTLTEVGRVLTNPGALGTAIDGAGGYAISTDYGSNDDKTVTLLRATTGEVLGTVGVGSHPLMTVLDRGTRTAYVTNQGDSTVSVLSPGTLAPVDGGDPGTPGHPGDPGSPGNPATPGDSVNPATPGDSVNPGNPGGPGTPAPAKKKIAAAKATSLKARKGNARVRLVLTGGTKVRTTIRLRTRGKVRTSPRGKARVVTLATRTVSRPGTVTLTLTKTGRTVLRRYAKLTVSVRVTPRGGKAVTRKLTLKRAR